MIAHHKNIKILRLIKVRAVVSTGSTGSIEPVDFKKRRNGTCEIAKMIRIESVNFHDIGALEPFISKT